MASGTNETLPSHRSQDQSTIKAFFHYPRHFKQLKVRPNIHAWRSCSYEFVLLRNMRGYHKKSARKLFQIVIAR